MRARTGFRQGTGPPQIHPMCMATTQVVTANTCVCFESLYYKFAVAEASSPAHKQHHGGDANSPTLRPLERVSSMPSAIMIAVQAVRRLQGSCAKGDRYG
jgi:hypothetical protein